MGETNTVIPGLNAARRQLIQGLAITLAPLGVAFGLWSDADVLVWMPVVGAILSAGVALPNVPKGSLRAWIYGLVLVLATAATTYGVVNESTAPLIVATIAVILSGGVALPNTTDDPGLGGQ